MTPPRLDVDACQEKLALLADLVADLDRHTDLSGTMLRADRDRAHRLRRLHRGGARRPARARVSRQGET